MQYAESFEHIATEHPHYFDMIIGLMKSGEQVEFMGQDIFTWLEVSIIGDGEEISDHGCYLTS